jgi:hypothetical protein
VWLDGDATADPAPARRLTVILRNGFVRQAAPAGPPTGQPGTPLGRTLFAGGTPTAVIEVSVSAVSAVVMSAPFIGRRVLDLPAGLRQHLIGRALGRVIAHEIGHEIGGRGHTAGGLMMPGASGVVLIDRHAPAAPPGWIAALRSLPDPSGCR